MPGQSYSEKTKSAVMAALLEGQAVSHVAAEYEIPVSTAYDWKRRALSSYGNSPEQKKGGDSPVIGDLLMELLEQNIRSLILISETAADKEWLRDQDASEVATLFGVKHDKAIRMIEALNRSDDVT